MKTYQPHPLSLSAAKPNQGRPIGQAKPKYMRSILLMLCLCACYVAQAQLSGTYTIDASKSASASNYKDFHSAVADLDSGKRYDGGTANGKGVKGAVVFYAADGTYDEYDLQITAIPGSSATNTVMFTSKSQDSSKVVLKHSYTSALAFKDEYGLFYINGASNIIFDHISLRSITTVGSFAVPTIGLYNGVSNFKVLHCNIQNTSINFGAGIVLNDNYYRDSDKTIQYTYFSNCSQAILFVGAPAYRTKNTIITDNVADYNGSVFFSGTYLDGLIFERNTMTDSSSSVFDYAVKLTCCKNLSSISNDIIYGQNGIYLDSCSGTTAKPALIANNVINTSGNSFGLVGGTYINIYYNNFNTYYYSAASIQQSKNINFVNNSMQHASHAGLKRVCLVLDNATSISQCDYNNYNFIDSIGIYKGNFILSLADWVKATGLDKNSINYDPEYDLSNDLKTRNTALLSSGTPVSGVLTDILGNTRSTTAPTIGAYEKIAKYATGLSGRYTIDPSKSASVRNYKDFHSAFADLDSGKRYDGGPANGPGVYAATIFYTADGIYDEHGLVLTTIPGSSATNTVRFTSASQDSSKAVIKHVYTTLNDTNYTSLIRLQDVADVSIDHLGFYMIQPKNSNEEAIIVASGMLQNFTLSHCYMHSSMKIFTIGFVVLNNSTATANDSNIIILQNRFIGGQEAIGLNGSKSHPIINVLANQNVMDSMYGFISGFYLDGFTADKNVFHNGDDFMFISSSKNLGDISDNIIQSNTGVVLDSCSGSAGTPSLVSNNIINCAGVGISLRMDSFVNIFYNNIRLIKSTNLGGSGYAAVALDSFHKINIENNIVVIDSGRQGPARCLWIFRPGSFSTFDYNDYYPGDSIATVKYAKLLTLSAWQTATGFDKHSLTYNPQYDSTNNLKTGDTSLKAKGTPIKDVKVDILGYPRNILAPTIGAYEISTPSVLKAGYTYSYVTANCSDNFVTVKFTDTSFVSNPGDSIRRTWSIDAYSNYNKSFNYKFYTEGWHKFYLYVVTASGKYKGFIDSVNIHLPSVSNIVFGNVCDTLVTVNFKDSISSSNGVKPSKYLWNFGDGDSSNSANPVYTYPVAARADSFLIKLNITTTGGCTQTLVRELYPVKMKPAATATASSCGNVVFKNNTTIDKHHTCSYVWDFGDGSVSTDNAPTHKYHAGGTYPYSLTAYSNNCSKTYTGSVSVGQYLFIGGHFSVSNNCAPDSVVFTDSTIYKYGTAPYTFSIDFGDSSTPATSLSATYSHKFYKPGTYTVTHSITDATGCTNYYTQVIVVNQEITAGFEYTRTCHNGVIFTDQSTATSGKITSWLWDFGDGDTTGRHIQNPVHTYAKNGNYYAKLTVSNGSCKTSTAQNVYFSIVTLLGQSTGCLSDSIYVYSGIIYTSPSLSYKWTIVGETIDSLYTGSSELYQKFVHPGYRKILLTITYSGGCTDTISKTVFVDSTCVWPGDADYNKKVNIKDILPIGVAYGKTGATRPGASLSWYAQPCTDWSKTFKSGINYKEADCNGDGKVDTSDIRAIVYNWGYTHPKAGAPLSGNPNDPPLSVTFNKDSVNAGDTVLATIALGSATIQAKDVYGLALTLNYSPSLTKSISGDFTNSWLGTINKNLFYLVMDDGKGALDVGISRNDQTDVSGYGKIAVLSIIMTDNIAGKREVKDLFKLNFTDYKAISADETNIDLNPIGDSVQVYEYKSGINNSAPDAVGWQIYPNPANSVLHIKTTNSAIYSVRITDLLGNTVYTETSLEQVSTDIPVSNLAKGMYIIDMITTKGNVKARFVKE